MIGLSRLWNAVFPSQSEDNTEESVGSDKVAKEESDDEQNDETIELNLTVEQITISPDKNK